VSRGQSLRRSKRFSKPIAFRANGEKSKVLIVISSLKRHEYELAPDTAGARIRPRMGA
jgi:hypothetical protein